MNLPLRMSTKTTTHCPSLHQQLEVSRDTTIQFAESNTGQHEKSSIEIQVIESKKSVNSAVNVCDIDSSPSSKTIQCEPEKKIPKSDISDTVEKDWPSVYNSVEWQQKKKDYPWLSCKNGAIGCHICEKICDLGVHGSAGVKISQEWKNYLILPSGNNKDSILTAFRSKIYKHKNSQAHKTAQMIFDAQEKETIQKSINQVIFNNLTVTEHVFNTVYYIAKNNRPYSDHPDLIELQKINECNVGVTLHSRTSAMEIISHISREMRQKIVIHCMNHRIELAINDAIKHINAIDTLIEIVNSIYSFYSMSPKNTSEIRDISSELHSQFLKIGKVFDVRWVASSKRTVKSLWVSFKSLVTHFERICADQTRSNLVRAKCKGVVKKLSSPEFVSNLGVMYDVLSELSILSEELQNNSMTLCKADNAVQRTICVLEARKFNIDETKCIIGMQKLVFDRGNFPNELKYLQSTINTLSAGTSECERGFSQMNLVCSDLRTNLTVLHIQDLLFININGPPVSLFKAKKYAQSWVQKHRNANDNRTRKVDHSKITTTYMCKLPMWNLLNAD
ncbi:hypothetical protein B566_EDAN011454 [Ephemera danica]|nr:hypothetical protein B566_EDAN011454 [Ephemera danica]